VKQLGVSGRCHYKTAACWFASPLKRPSTSPTAGSPAKDRSY
jgi:hypothetical protein